MSMEREATIWIDGVSLTPRQRVRVKMALPAPAQAEETNGGTCMFAFLAILAVVGIPIAATLLFRWWQLRTWEASE